MKKTKTFENVIFSPEVIKEAEKLFKANLMEEELANISSRFTLERQSENLRWEFDSFDEFISEYRTGCTEASLSFNFGEYNLDFLKYLNHTEITIGAPKHHLIDRLMEIFEENWENSKVVLTETKSDSKYITFDFEKRISSGLVNKDLILELQNYILNEIPKITSISSEIFSNRFEIISNRFEISVADSIGTETFNDISKFRNPYFHDTTKSIIISLKIYSPKQLTLYIKFDEEKSSSRISIGYSSENSREVVIAIYEGLTRILEQYKNINRIFHPSYYLSIIIFVLIWSAFVATIYLYQYNYLSHAIISTSAMLLMILYLFSGKYLKPYICFETRRYSTKKKWVDWFIFGFLGFLIFGTLLVLLRKQILGF